MLLFRVVRHEMRALVVTEESDPSTVIRGFIICSRTPIPGKERRTVCNIDEPVVPSILYHHLI